MILYSAFAYSFCSFFGSTTILYFCLRYKIYLGLIAEPDTRVDTHTSPIPLIGGLIIGLVSLPITYILLDQLGNFENYIFGLTPLILLGFYKDKTQKALSPFLQFGIQGFSSYFLYAHWLTINSLTFDWLWFFTLILIFNLLINSFNFLDVSDGLAGSYSLVLLGVLTLIATFTGQIEFLYLLVLFIGAKISFLLFNWNPAKVFLGDVGSFGMMYMLLFALISLVPIKGVKTILPLGCFLFVPMLEFTFTVTRRIWFRKLPYKGDGKHLSLLLLNNGWSSSKIAISSVLLSILMGGIGIYILLKQNLMIN